MESEPTKPRTTQYGERDAYWHCSFCGNNEPAHSDYAIGDSEPCCLCGEGTARVMTLKEAAKFEQEIALGIRQPKRSYT